MKTFLERMMRNAPGDGGGGASAGGDPAAAAAASAAPGAQTPSPSPSAGGAPPAADGGSNAPPAETYRPDGLPDNMFGKSDRETMDNMAKALKGYRDRDSQNTVPDKVEAYRDFGAEVAPELKPHIDTLAKDPLFDRMTAYALENKLPLPVFQGMTKHFLSVAAELGMMEPPIDVEAERKELVPATHRHLPEAEQRQAREQRMNDNFAFLDQMAQVPKDQGGLSKEAADFAKMMLGDSAKGHEFIEFLRANRAGGTGPHMGDGGGRGGDARAELAKRAALPQNTWGHPQYDPKSRAELDADYAKLLGK